VIQPPTVPEPYRVKAAVRELEARGLPVVPCHPGTKRPVCAGWQTRDPAEQIEEACQRYGWSFNVAIRLDVESGIVALDLDDGLARHMVPQILDSALVDSYPVQRSASGGRHLILRCDDIPAEAATRQLHPGLGCGEVRVGQASILMVAPSIVEGGSYAWLEDLTMLGEMDPVAWDTIAALLPRKSDKSATATSTQSCLLNVIIDQLPQQAMPAVVRENFDLLEDAAKGQAMPHQRDDERVYRTRSEMEQSIRSTLILCGWDKEEIRQAFRHHLPGHYAEQGDADFDFSYRNARLNLIDTDVRHELLEFLLHVLLNPWSLKGYLTRQVLVWMIAIAVREADWEHCPSLAELCAVVNAPASSVLTALSDLAQQTDWVTRYEVNGQLLYGLKQNREIPMYSHRGDDTALMNRVERALSRRPDHLLPSVMPVYEALGAGAHTQKALAQSTGLDPKTVRTALHSLAEHGFAARQSAHQWTAGPEALSIARVRLHSRSHGPLTTEAAEPPPPDLTDARNGGTDKPLNPILEHIRATDLRAILGVGCPHKGHEDPLTVYARAMAAVYGADHLRVYMLEGHRQRFDDVRLALGYHAGEGTLPDACLACFIERMALRCQAWVAEEGQAYLYPQILASAGMVGWYARLHGSATRDKVEAAAWHRRRGLFHSEWESGFTEAGDRIIRQGPDGWALVEHPDGQTEFVNLDGQIGTALAGRSSAESPSRQPLDDRSLPRPDDPVLHHHNDGWVTRRAADGQHYLDMVEEEATV
jgi:hypothetical protein